MFEHLFETPVECLSAGQSYLCYIFFYEIAYYDFGNFAFLFNCTPVGRTSDSMMVPT